MKSVVVDPVHEDMRVLGLDLSLTSTGVAHVDGTPDRLAPPRLTGMERLAWLRSEVHRLVLQQRLTSERLVDLVVIEGYAMGSKRQSHSYATGELGGVIRLMLHTSLIPYVEVAPASLKKYATGKGNASKDEVLAEAIRRLQYQGANNDEADAMWLRQMALCAYAEPDFVGMPATNRSALTVVDWPVIGDHRPAVV